MGEDQINYIVDSLKGEYESKRTSSLNNGSSDTGIGLGSSALLKGITPNKRTPVSATSEVYIDINQTHERTSQGEYIAKYDTFDRFGNTAEDYAQNQKTSEKWKNGLLKFGGKTLTATVGSIVGGAYGIFDYMRTGSETALYDNSITNYFSDLDKMMNNKLPNYYTQKEIDGSFTDNLFTANFIANDVLGGLSFTAGAIGSELLLSKGAGLIPKLSRLPQYLNRVSKAKSVAVRPIVEASKSGVLYADEGIAGIQASINLGKTQELAKTMRFIYTSSGYEASIEALQFKNEQLDNFNSTFFEQNGREPSAEESAKFRENLDRATNSLWMFNVAVTGSSKMAQIGNLVGIKTPSLIDKAWVSRKVFGSGIDATGKAIKADKFQKGLRFAYANIGSSLSEGLEEGLQSVGSNTAEKWLTSTYDPKHISSMLDVYDGFMSSFSDMITTEQGRKEFLTGALVGGITGRAIGAITGQTVSAEFKRSDKRAEEFESYSKKQIMESIAFSGRMSESQAKLDKAEAEGNLAMMDQARKEQTLAVIEYYKQLGYEAEGRDMSVEAIRNIDNKELAKTFGISEQDAEAYKQEMIDTYDRLNESYNKNLEFASYYVGSDVKNASDVHSAIAATLTLGEGAYDFNKNILGTLKQKLASHVTGIDTLDIHDALSFATENTREEFNQARQEIKAQREELNRLEQERKKALSSSQREKETTADRLNDIAISIQTGQERIVELENKLTDILQVALLENPYSDKNAPLRRVSEADLNTLDKVLNSISDLPKRISATNPALGRTIDNMIREYNRSNRMFKGYATMSQMITEGKVDFNKLFSKTFKDKTKEELVLDFLNSISLDEEGKRITSAQKEAEDSERVSKMVGGMKLHRPTNEKVEIPVGDEGNIIRSNPYLQHKSKDGNISDQKPTEEEIQRYEELFVKEDKTPEEVEELDSLEGKISQWELYDDFVGEGVSIPDLLEIERQLEEAPRETEQEVTPQLLGEIVEDSSKVQRRGERSEQISQTYEGVQIRTTKDGTFLHSTDKENFFSNLGDVAIEEKGEVSRITHPDGTTTEFKEVRPGVLKVEGWENLERNTPVERMKYNYSKGTYGFVYVNGEMMKGSLEGNPVYNYEAVYDLKPGDEVTFYVDANDTFNQKLDEADLETELKIYIVDSHGNVVGDLKANRDIKGTFDNFVKLREMAVEVFKNGGGNIPASMKVEHVYLGTPVFRLENGVPKMGGVDSRDIVAIGYYDGSGKFDLNKELDGVRTSFVSKLKRKTPVIVINRGGYLVAFPVAVRNVPSNKGSEVVEKLNGENIGKAVIFANQQALENGLPAELYFKGSDNQNIFDENGDFTDTVKNLVTALNEKAQEIDVLKLSDSQIKENVFSPINPGSRPFTSPKIVLEMDSMTTTATTVQPISLQTNTKTNKVKAVKKVVNKQATPKKKATKNSSPTQPQTAEQQKTEEDPPQQPQSPETKPVEISPEVNEDAGVVPVPETTLTKVTKPEVKKEPTVKVAVPKTPPKTVVEVVGRRYVVNNTKEIVVDGIRVEDKIYDSDISKTRVREFKFKEGATLEDFKNIVEDGDLVFGRSNVYAVTGNKLVHVDKPIRGEVDFPSDPKNWAVAKTIGILSDIDTESIQNKKC